MSENATEKDREEAGNHIEYVWLKCAKLEDGRVHLDRDEAVNIVLGRDTYIRSEAVQAERVCGNCKYGKATSLDDTRCYESTPYSPTGRRCKACDKWELCDVIQNPKAILSSDKESTNG